MADELILRDPFEVGFGKLFQKAARTLGCTPSAAPAFCNGWGAGRASSPRSPWPTGWPASGGP
jgi:hypothetical protein